MASDQPSNKSARVSTALGRFEIETTTTPTQHPNTMITLARRTVARGPLSYRFVRRTLSTSSSEFIKLNDRPTYLADLLLPSAEAREAVFATQHFHRQVERTYRHGGLVFWREALNDVYSDRQVEDVHVHELQRVAVPLKLKRRWFERVLDVYQLKLDGEVPFETLADIDSFAEQTACSVLYLSLEACGVRDMHADHAASHIGKSLWMLDQVFALIHKVQTEKDAHTLDLPSIVLQENKLTIADVTDFNSLPNQERLNAINGLTEVVYEMASHAHGHLHHARDLSKQVPDEAKPALLVSFVADAHLQLLEKCQWNPLDERLVATPALLGFQFRLLRAAWQQAY